jgi:hypothetical protein
LEYFMSTDPFIHDFPEEFEGHNGEGSELPEEFFPGEPELNELAERLVAPSMSLDPDRFREQWGVSLQEAHQRMLERHAESIQFERVYITAHQGTHNDPLGQRTQQRQERQPQMAPTEGTLRTRMREQALQAEREQAELTPEEDGELDNYLSRLGLDVAKVNAPLPRVFTTPTAPVRPYIPVMDEDDDEWDDEEGEDERAEREEEEEREAREEAERQSDEEREDDEDDEPAPMRVERAVWVTQENPNMWVVS